MIQINVHMKRAHVAVIQKIVEAAIKAKYPDARVVATRAEPPTSRADRFEELKGFVEDALTGAEELREELQNWNDNLPEGLQGGDKSSALEEAVGQLDEFISNAEQARDIEVEFPSMMG